MQTQKQEAALCPVSAPVPAAHHLRQNKQNQRYTAAHRPCRKSGRHVLQLNMVFCCFGQFKRQKVSPVFNGADSLPVVIYMPSPVIRYGRGDKRLCSLICHFQERRRPFCDRYPARMDLCGIFCDRTFVFRKAGKIVRIIPV